MRQDRNVIGQYFDSCLVLIFFLWELFVITNHVMWRDEWQAFLIARHSSSVLDLFWNARYEGHPALWFVCLYLLKYVSTLPIMMQLFHLTLATGVIYIFLKQAPFSHLKRVLFVFGYFPFFEYSIISRNYAIGVLCTIILCSLFRPSLKKNYLLISFILFILSQSSVYGLIIAIAFASTFFFEFFLNQDIRGSFSERRFAILAGIIIFASGVAVSLFQMIPPAESSSAVPWTFAADPNQLECVLNTFWRSYVPIPQFNIEFWDSNFITNKHVQFILSIGLIFYCFILFVRKPAALLFYSTASLGVILFCYLRYFGCIRHFGHLFIIFISALWISCYYPERRIGLEKLDAFVDCCLKAKDKFLYSILILQLAAGLIANASDLIFPFSGSKETAKFLEQNYPLDETILIGDTDLAASAVGGYLDRRIFFPRGNRWGTFVVWDRQRAGDISDRHIVEKARELVSQYQRDALLIMNRPLNSGTSSVSLVHKVDRSVVFDEIYFIYQIRRTSLN